MKTGEPASALQTARDEQSRADLLGGQAILAGIRGLCPRCGEGRLFEGFLKVPPACDACGHELASVETGDGAATFIIQIAGFVVGFSALAVEIAWRPPIWLHLILWLPLVAALALGLMRPGKGLMIALQMLRTRDPK